MELPHGTRTLLVQHLGLGDALMCNALTRHVVATRETPVGLFCQTQNLESVGWMVRDLGDDLRLIETPKRPPAGMDKFEDIWTFCDTSGLPVVNLSMFREHQGTWTSGMLDLHFYRYGGIPIMRKFTDWDYDRDETIEVEPPSGDYVLVHQDPDRGYVMHVDKIRHLQNQVTFQSLNLQNVFAMRKVIEQASEVHVINSAFLHLVDFFEPRGKLYWHYYARVWEGQSDPILQRDWVKVL